jgi:hypothetical protein
MDRVLMAIARGAPSLSLAELQERVAFCEGFFWSFIDDFVPSMFSL